MSAHGGAERRLAAILSADAVGYSRLMSEDEAATVAALGRARASVREQVASHRGRVVDAVGDNLLALFASAVDAVVCALAIQEALEASGPGALRFRIGVHLGDVRVEGESIFGDAVNVAARLEAEAEPGGVCLSGAVRDQLHGRLPVELDDLGERRFKNVPAPIPAFRVRSAQRAKPDPIEPQAAREPPVLAVLPFLSLSSNQEHAFLADGMTEDLTTQLARTPELTVIARTSMFSYKGRSVDVRDVGRELGARYVIEGSVRVLGPRVRVTVQLVEAETAKHLWAERFDRELEQLFELQDEVLERVVAQLHPELVRAESRRAERAPPGSVDAWALYQRVVDLLSMRGETPEPVAEAVALLERTLELDPDFAHAVALRASLLASRASMHEDGDERLRAAVAEGRRALSLAPDDPIVLRHWARVQLAAVGPEASVPLLERALALGSNDPQDWVALGVNLSTAGRYDEAVGRIEKALRLSPRDPRSWAWHQILANTHLLAGRWDLVLVHAEHATALNERFPAGWGLRAACLARLDRLDEAGRCVASLRERAPGISLEGAAALWQMFFGGKADDPARASLREELLGLLRRAGLE